MILIYWKGKVWSALKTFCTNNKINYEIKDDSDNMSDFSKYSKIIPSPWVPPTHKIYKTWKIEWEMDFIYPFIPKWFKIICVSWTDWKSTTTWILYNILKQHFQDKNKLSEKEKIENSNYLIIWGSWIFLSWNFDESFSSTISEIQKRWIKSGFIVAEISSFMAYNIKKFKSDYSIFTNFELDHLNWHKDIQDYLDAKLNIFKNTKKKAIINLQVLQKIKELKINNWKLKIKNIRTFGISDNKKLKDRVELLYIIISWKKKYDINETKFSWSHNALSILASTMITNEMKICSKKTKIYLKNISWLPHRIEFVKEIKWIKFYDDSKSTSTQSLKAALGSFDWNIILIAGWSDKWDKFEWLDEILKTKVIHGELIWQTREIFGKILNKNKISFHYSDSMDEAVKTAFKKAKSGDIILLSPWCASFGMFKNYLDRAEKFREAVKKLK